MTRIHRLVALAAAAAALGATSIADAATVSRSGTTITYRAGSGEVNRLGTDVSSAGQLSILESPEPTAGGVPKYPMTNGAGCAPPTQGNYRITTCDAAGAKLLVLELGDQRDELSMVQQPMALELPAGMKLTVDGGAGNDVLIGSRGSDLLKGGSGNDSIGGSGGKDTFEGGAGNDNMRGSGTLRGGAGNDTFQLFHVTAAIKVFASKVFGGAGNDSVVSGNRKRDTIDCGTGKKDVVLWGKYKGEDKLKRCERTVP